MIDKSQPKLKDLEQAIDILLEYDGYNPYIQRMRDGIKKRVPDSLTSNKVKYILKNHSKELQTINKMVNITEYFGEGLRNQYNLDFIPKKIFVYYYFGDSDKTYHVWGKISKSIPPRDYFIPKTQILGDLFHVVKKINVNYELYDKLLSRIGRKVLPHQPEAIEFLLSMGKSILADGMGLCKTSSAIIASIEGDFKKILIVCPASLKLNWFKELTYLSIPTSDIAIINSNKWVSNKKYTIINYDILHNFYEYIGGRKSKEKEILIKQMLDNSPLIKENFDLIIIDEAHCLSNLKSDRSLILGDFMEKGKINNRWLLTGTPITKRPINFFNLLKLVECPVADDWSFYVKRYCEGKNFQKKDKKTGLPIGKQIWVTNGASNLEELRDKTKYIRLVRKIEDYIDMPEKIEIPQFYDLSNEKKKEYNELYETFIQEKMDKELDNFMSLRKITDIEKGKEIFVNDLKTIQALMETGVIKKFLAMEMINNTIELIDNALEEDKKIIVFTNYTEELMCLYDKYKDIAVIHYGGLTDKKKEESINKFQNDDKCKIFIGNLKSAGVGLTLTKADIEIFNSMHWLPGINKQAICRSWRNGRKLPVTVYFNMFTNTKSEEWYNENMIKENEIEILIS